VDRHIGAEIERRRIELGISREGLSQTLGVSSKSLAAFEAGQAPVDAVTLTDIARNLNCPPSAFFRVLGIAAQLHIDGLRESGNKTGASPQRPPVDALLSEKISKVDLLVQAFRIMSGED